MFRLPMEWGLRSRTQLSVGALLLIFFILAMTASWFTLRNSFDQFERNNISHELSRLELWLSEELDSLRRSTNDYGFWDDTYTFALGINPGYADENIIPEVFDNLDIDVLAVITTDGDIHHAEQHVNDISDETRLVSLQTKMSSWLKTRPVIDAVQQSVKPKAVINHLNGVPVLIAAAPILHSDNSGPSTGTILMLRILNSRRIAMDNPQPKMRWTIMEATPDKPIVAGITQSDNNFQINSVFKGRNDEGTTFLSLQSEAQLQSQFNTVIKLSSINLALMALATLLLLGVILNRQVLNRLLFFSQRADEVRTSGDLALRIPHENKDELDHLALTVNEMLDELLQTNRQLYHDSLHDPLTGLGNRALLDERLNYTLTLSRLEDETLALMIIDLDGFKNINDLHGHAAGDAILARTAVQIAEWAHPADTTVRLGGDEFAIIRILSTDSIEILTKNVDELRQSISHELEWKDERLRVSASIGIALSDPKTDKETASDLLRNADIALYKAKEDGRDRSRFFCPDMRQQLFEKMTLMQELEDAIANDKLILHFQPIINRHGKAYSVEALVRWPHKQRGLISPDAFIPIAEKSLLITRLDLWVIKAACAALKRIHNNSPPTLCITINCSARTLLEEDVTGKLLSEMEINGLPPGTVHIELTETALARNETEMVPILERMAGNDIRIYLDDFGTGYSSLNRLHLLPFHHLKVDRSFVRRIDKGDETITRSIIQLAQSLGKTVVVEGVETENQRKILNQLSADYMQGYLFSRPLPEGELIKWLSQHS